MAKLNMELHFKQKATLSEKFWNWLKKVLGLESPPVIMAYRGYGTPTQVYVRGHVLDDRVLYEAQLHDRRRKNLKAMLSRYLSKGVADVRVGIQLADYQQETRTNASGYFEAVFECTPPLQQRGWLPVQYRVLDPLPENAQNLVQTGEVYVQETQAVFGIISDVDDTILISHSGATLKKLGLILWKNAKTRLPFKGVAAFYQALQRGAQWQVHNPIFYVSSSEWNLYDFLEDFCKVRAIPKGPFLLKNLKTGLLELFKSGGGKHHHKLEKIIHLMALFTDLKFILIGDSSQKDATIYTEVARQFPQRVLAIYIRSVSQRRKLEVVLKLATQLKEQKIEMLLVNDTAVAAQHALERGWIDAAAYAKVREEVEGKPPLSRQAVPQQ